MAKKYHNPIAEYFFDHINQSSTGKRRLKLRTLLDKFGYERRSDNNMNYITQCLNDVGLEVHPPLIRFGDTWEIGIDDSVYISFLEDDIEGNVEIKAEDDSEIEINSDGWFDSIKRTTFRSEDDVNERFVLPLLYKLGYGDADILKEKRLPNSRLRSDFILFNKKVKKNMQPATTCC